jgi:hypothetical protein
MSIRHLFSHPLSLGWALVATLLIIVGLDRIAGTEGAYSMLARVGQSVGQQVVVVGHRLAQEVVVVGHRLGGRD